jgi:hypothetical protein
MKLIRVASIALAAYVVNSALRRSELGLRGVFEEEPTSSCGPTA